MIWTKIGTKISALQGTTITYRLMGTSYTVESRKRPIPHANRPGTWEHTSYFVLKDGVELIEKFTLKAAKAFAEAEAERPERS